MSHNINKKGLTKQRYTQFADGYVTSKTHATGSDLATLRELANPQPDWHMLDIATGGGHTARTFAPHVQQVTATDLTPDMLAAAERHITGQGITNVDFRLADAETLPFEDGIFDLVTCRIAPHHFIDVPQFLRESARVLAQDGIFAMQDHMLSPNNDIATITEAFETLRDPSHNRAFTENQWRTMVENTGLVVKATHHLTKRHSLIPWAQRQGNDTATIEALRTMVSEASQAVREWMQVRDWDSEEASFVNHHLIIVAAKHQPI